MAYEVFVGDRQGIEDRLNGTLVLGPYPNTGLPLGGLTLIFATPAATVTFSGSPGANKTVDEIMAEIELAAATIVTTKRTAHNSLQYSASPNGGGPVVQMLIALRLDAGITIDKDGTANPLLKISTVADTVGRPAADPADIISFGQGLTQGHYAVIINL